MKRKLNDKNSFLLVYMCFSEERTLKMAARACHSFTINNYYMNVQCTVLLKIFGCVTNLDLQSGGKSAAQQIHNIHECLKQTLLSETH